MWHLQPRGYRGGGLNCRSPPGHAPPQMLQELEKTHQLERVLRQAQEKTGAFSTHWSRFRRWIT
jgi:hypothetical protein